MSIKMNTSCTFSLEQRLEFENRIDLYDLIRFRIYTNWVRWYSQAKILEQLQLFSVVLILFRSSRNTFFMEPKALPNVFAVQCSLYIDIEI